MILVTGSQGFVGSHLVKRLREMGEEVIGIDKQDRNFRDAHTNLFNDLREVSDEFLDMILTDVKKVYHLASDAGGSEYISKSENQFKMLEGNSEMDRKLIKACIRNNIQRIVYFSSSCVYSNFDEDAYGFEKLYGEYLVRHSGLRYVILRPQNIYGTQETLNGERERVLPALCRKALKSTNDLEVWGKGDQVRSFVHVQDLIDYLFYYEEKNDEGLDVIADIGGKYVTINELAEIVIKVSGKDLKIKNLFDKPTGVIEKKKFPFEEGKINLEDGVREVYQWISSHQ